MAALPLVLSIASTVVGAVSQIQQGKAADQIARFEARQLDRNAKASFAKGTREAAEQLRLGKIREGDIRAQLAGGGGVATDPGAVELLAENAAISEYNGLAAMYAFETQAQGQSTQAKARRVEGKTSKRTSRAKTLATVISGGGKAYQLYGDL